MSMSKKDEATLLFKSGFNCAQSVLSVFAGKYGLSRSEALRVSAGLGMGIRCGEICGAVAGAVMVVGLKFCNDDAQNIDSRNLCNEKTFEYMELFKAKNSSVICREILGCDLSTAEGIEKARPQFGTTCVKMVQDAVELLENNEY